MKRFANQQRPDIPLARNVFQLLEIISDTRAVQRVDTLCGDSKFIANGKPDSFLPHIEREYAAARPARFLTVIVSIQIAQLRIIEGITC
jgi:hypothetical protein